MNILVKDSIQTVIWVEAMVDEGEYIASEDESKHIRINFGTLDTWHSPKHVLFLANHILIVWNKWYHLML